MQAPLPGNRHVNVGVKFKKGGAGIRFLQERPKNAKKG
jgi:hypothetical protein